ncbi:MAG: ATP-grasp domain-containing protein [Gammaproteobacteria bacterium]|nr:ATP-grasp domain-containing protein [Gammaproteobacteria bacterium]
MPHPVIIVDPVSSGSDLAPAFAARGVPVIAIRSSKYVDSGDVGYAEGIRAANFLAIYDDGPELVDDLRALEPCAVIAGSEAGVELADKLSFALTPKFANVPSFARARRHKGEMQRALQKAGLPVIRTLNTASMAEVSDWLIKENLTHAALVLKPPASAGSDKVFHIRAGEDWKRPFDHILSTPTSLLGKISETVIIQEQITGIEYAVDTVSASGKHVLTDLIRYKKTSAQERMTVYDYTEFVNFDPSQHTELLNYAKQALDALGIRWGAAHSEIMLTQAGPRLIETGARMCGGPVLELARAATGSNQLERVVEAYLDGEIRTQRFTFRQTVLNVFLISPLSGTLRNTEVLDTLHKLPTHLSTLMWLRNGDHVERTVDFDTTLGIVSLAGNRDAVFTDYPKVREVEKKLIIEPA